MRKLMRVVVAFGLAGIGAASSGCGGSPLSSWDSLTYSISADDDVDGESDPFQREQRVVEIVDTHGTVDDCPALAADGTLEIGGTTLDEYGFLPGGDVPVSNGDFDLTPDFLKQKQCGSVFGLQTSKVGTTLQSDDITLAQANDARRVSIPGLGHSAALEPQFDIKSPHHVGEQLAFALAVPEIDDVTSGSTFSDPNAGVVDAHAPASTSASETGQIVTVTIPDGPTGNVSVSISLDFTMPCGADADAGYAACKASGSSSWSRTLVVQP